jgi:hypothetical protein
LVPATSNCVGSWMVGTSVISTGALPSVAVTRNPSTIGPPFEERNALLCAAPM